LMTVLSLSLKLILLIAVGYAAAKLRALPKGFGQVLTKIVLNVSLPALIISTFRIEFHPEQLLNCGILLIAAIGVIILSSVAGQIMCLWAGRCGPGRVARFGMIITNFTFFGMPVIETLYGSLGLFYYTVFTIPFRIVYYAAAAPLLSGKLGSGSTKSNIREFFSMPVIAVLVGIVIYVFGIELPGILDNTVTSLAATATPLALMVCGSLLADADLKSIFAKPVVFIAAAVRLLVLPAAALALGKLAGLSPILLQCVVIYCAMPVASLLPTFVVRYQPDLDSETLAGALVFVTTILCVLTIPLWALVLGEAA